MIQYTQEEKNIMYRLQTVIEKAPQMNDQLLKKMFYLLLPEKKDSKSVSSGKLEGRLISWWLYIGQWNWEQCTFSRKRCEELADRLLFKNKDIPDINAIGYPDDYYQFFSRVSRTEIEEHFSEFCVEIRPKSGKKSLWPKIYSCEDFTDLDSFLDALGLKGVDCAIAFCKPVESDQLVSSNDGQKLYAADTETLKEGVEE